MANFYSDGGLVGAAAERVLGPVTVVAENLETGRVAVAFEPTIKNMGRVIVQVFTLFRTAASDMVNRKEYRDCLSAARTVAAICLKNLLSPSSALFSLTGSILLLGCAQTDASFAPR